MSVQSWFRTAYTGNTSTSLDNIDEADITGSVATCLVCIANVARWFVWDSTSSTTADGTTIIAPHDTTGAGRWLFQGSPYDFGVGSMPTGVLYQGVSGGGYEHGTDTDHDIDFGPIACMDSTNTAQIKSTTTITKRIDATWVAGTGNGGLLNGSVTTDSIYWLYALVKDADGSVDFGFLKQGDAIATYCPSGYHEKLMGVVFTDASANIEPFTYNEITNTFVTDSDESIFLASVTATSGSGAWGSNPTDFDLSTVLDTTKIKRIGTKETYGTAIGGASIKLTNAPCSLEHAHIIYPYSDTAALHGAVLVLDARSYGNTSVSYHYLKYLELAI